MKKDKIEIMLKPCPFCGGDAKMQSDIRYPRPKCEAKTAFEVVCQNWDCIIGHVAERYYLSPKEAAEAWNRRAGMPLPPPPITKED